MPCRRTKQALAPAGNEFLKSFPTQEEKDKAVIKDLG